MFISNFFSDQILYSYTSFLFGFSSSPLEMKMICSSQYGARRQDAVLYSYIEHMAALL